MANIYSVTQLNSYIKNMFAQDYLLRKISIKGEVSNCKYHSSGHIYFTVKDSGGTLSAVMFASQRKGLSFQIQEGMQIIVTGSVEIYEKTGSYQIYAQKIEKEGQGDLFEKFLKLKEELEDMGMFSESYKKPIPKYSKTIGIVTAATGAAIRDIISITNRRNPYVQLVLYPALVQGEYATDSIVKGIEALDKYGVDVMIVGRGGGSIEDLWAFNEEKVARAIFSASVPVISAVGHETDFTIADYVADLRAATPSAAAELATIDYTKFIYDLDNIEKSLKNNFKRHIDDTHNRLNSSRLKLEILSPARKIREKRLRVEQLRTALGNAIQNKLNDKKHRLMILVEKLHGLSPLARISSGYAFVTDNDGKRVRGIKEVDKSDILTLRFADGKMKTSVLEIEDGERNR